AGQVAEFAVCGRAVNNGVPVVEVAVELAERRDLGRAYEGKVLRPEENHLPLAGGVLVGDTRECLLLVGGYHRLEVELRNAVAYGQHRSVSFERVDHCYGSQFAAGTIIDPTSYMS